MDGMALFETRNAKIAGISAFGVVFAIGVFVYINRAPTVQDTGMETPALTALTPTVQPAVSTSAPTDPVASTATPTTAPAAPEAPAFDEVRREVDGMTVIAGRAAPGSTVRVLDNGAQVATATADASGKFATLAMLPPDSKAQVLSLEATSDAGPIASAEEVILAPIPAATATPEQGPDVVAAAPEPDAPTAATVAMADPAAPQTAPAQTSDVAPSSQTPQAETLQAEQDTASGATDAPATAQAPPQQMALLKSNADGVELMPDTAPSLMDSVALDIITYSDAGEVRLAGRAQVEASSVRVYLNNKSVVSLPVDQRGRWRGDLEGIDTGIYTLRVDELDKEGAVISRVETPFKRESPENLARAIANYDGPIHAVTVQEGATLWAIARERYGDPMLYVRVFEANRDNIRDPDLIYPGQIFSLPD